MHLCGKICGAFQNFHNYSLFVDDSHTFLWLIVETASTVDTKLALLADSDSYSSKYDIYLGCIITQSS